MLSSPRAADAYDEEEEKFDDFDQLPSRFLEIMSQCVTFAGLQYHG